MLRRNSGSLMSRRTASAIAFGLWCLTSMPVPSPRSSIACGKCVAMIGPPATIASDKTPEVGWSVTEIIGTRFIPAKHKILGSRRFIATVNWYAELINLKGFTMRACVQDRNGADNYAELDASFVYCNGRVVGLTVDYDWSD